MFYRKIAFSVLLFCHVSVVIANEDVVTCPSIAEIKDERFQAWLPLYKDGEELASQEDVEKFKKHVMSFETAIWSGDYLESAHCFYRGEDAIVNKIIFGQDSWNPVTSQYWYWERPARIAKCNSSVQQDCRFIK